MKTTLFIFFSIFAHSSFAQRIVLAELFSNSSCPPCASNTPQVTDFIMSNPSNSIAIVYHTNFPYTNDSMYHENTVDNNARILYYSISYAPSTVMDGNVYNGSTPAFLPTMSSTISNRSLVAPQYEITPISAILNENTLSVSFAFESLGNYVNEALNAHIVVVEETVLKSSYAASPGNNNETEYHYVMRKMLPDASGTTLQNRELNGKDTVTLSWNLEHIKSTDEIRVVAFVQNQTSKEIYQTEYTTPMITTSVEHPAVKEDRLIIYPNPSEGDFIVEHSEISEAELILFDVNGRTIQPEIKRINSAKLYVSLKNFSQGVYFIQMQTPSELKTGKLIIR